MVKHAYYDVKQDKIYGKRNTIEYWHEKGHQWLQHEFNISLIQECVVFFLLYSLCFDSLNKFKGFFFWIWICITLFDEIFAWIYAKIQYNKIKKAIKK